MLLLGIFVAFGFGEASEVRKFRERFPKTPWKPNYAKVQDFEYIHSIQRFENANREYNRIVYLLVSGNVIRAKARLKALGQRYRSLTPRLQYLYMLSLFALKRYKEAQGAMTARMFYDSKWFRQSCPVFSLSLGGNEGQEIWKRCELYLGRREWPREYFKRTLNPDADPLKLDIAAIERLENRPLDYATYIQRLLYFADPTKLNPLFEFSTIEQLRNVEVSALLGAIAYRRGELVKSFQLIEDLGDPNSENIKGNMYALQNKLELALAQHKLAYLQKRNSLNALERLIPLAWELKQYKDGLSYLPDVAILDGRSAQLSIVRALFLAQLKRWDEAYGVLIREDEQTQKVPLAREILLLSALEAGKSEAIALQSKLACDEGNSLGCWAHIVSKTFKNVGGRFKSRSAKWHHQQELDIIEDKAEIKETSFGESLFVSQSDLEEYEEQKELQLNLGR